uniref:mRNA cap guanine-N(7) methyltransferase n=1 Tax=Rhipicephalus appendiculatus TaxID=34631 RepID=A0A131YLM5_RHIAP
MSEENLSAGDTNSAEGLAPVVQNHYNSIGNNGLQERERSRILHMRNFNNWTKSMLIREYIAKRKEDKPEDSPFHVLDLGAGKGGDLLKWKKGDISYLICADIAGTSLQHAEERFRELKERHRRQREPGRIFQAEFIEADCTRVRLKDRYKYKDIALDIVSCQFTFHYSFESLPQAQCMLRNAAECLVPGGYFIGTTPDANDLVRRVREAPGLKFGNDVFHIEFLGSKEELPLFGAQYDFHLEGVVDCPEFLVNFDVLEEMAKEFDLRLVYKKRFEDFFDQFKDDPEGKVLLRKMQALEAYPPFGDQTTLGKDPDDYKHAVEQLEKIKDQEPESRRRPQVGTLSQAEWEALSIYVVFAFQKDPNAGRRSSTSDK